MANVKFVEKEPPQAHLYLQQGDIVKRIATGELYIVARFGLDEDDYNLVDFHTGNRFTQPDTLDNLSLNLTKTFVKVKNVNIIVEGEI